MRLFNNNNSSSSSGTRSGAIHGLLVAIAAMIICSGSLSDAVDTTLTCNRPCQNIVSDPIPAASNLELTWSQTNNYLPSHFDIVLAWGVSTNMLNTLIAFLNYSQPVQNATAQTYTTSITLPSDVPSGDYYWIMITPHDVANYSAYASNHGPYHIYGSDLNTDSTKSIQYPFKIDVVCGNNAERCGGMNVIQPGRPLLVSWSYSTATFQASIFWGNPDKLGLTSAAVVQLFPYMNTVSSNGQNSHNFSISVSTQSLLSIVPPGPYYYVGVESTNSATPIKSFAGPFTIQSSSYSSQSVKMMVSPQGWLMVGCLLISSVLFFGPF